LSFIITSRAIVNLWWQSSGLVVGRASYYGVCCGVKLRRLETASNTASVWRRGREATGDKVLF
jgi:hypothetical protein